MHNKETDVRIRICVSKKRVYFFVTALFVVLIEKLVLCGIEGKNTKGYREEIIKFNNMKNEDIV